jgi:hypothetical protein
MTSYTPLLVLPPVQQFPPSKQVNLNGKKKADQTLLPNSQAKVVYTRPIEESIKHKGKPMAALTFVDKNTTSGFYTPLSPGWPDSRTVATAACIFANSLHLIFESDINKTLGINTCLRGMSIAVSLNKQDYIKAAFDMAALLALLAPVHGVYASMGIDALSEIIHYKNSPPSLERQRQILELLKQSTLETIAHYREGLSDLIQRTQELVTGPTIKPPELQSLWWNKPLDEGFKPFLELKDLKDASEFIPVALEPKPSLQSIKDARNIALRPNLKSLHKIKGSLLDKYVYQTIANIHQAYQMVLEDYFFESLNPHNAENAYKILNISGPFPLALPAVKQAHQSMVAWLEEQKITDGSITLPLDETTEKCITPPWDTWIEKIRTAYHTVLKDYFSDFLDPHKLDDAYKILIISDPSSLDLPAIDKAHQSIVAWLEEQKAIEDSPTLPWDAWIKKVQTAYQTIRANPH